MLLGLDISPCNPLLVRPGLWGQPASGPSAPSWYAATGDAPGEVKGQIFQAPSALGDGPVGGDGAGSITGYAVTIAGVTTFYAATLPIDFTSAGHAEGAPITVSVRALGYGGRPGLLTTQTPTAAVSPPIEVEVYALLNAVTGAYLHNKVTGARLLDKFPPAPPTSGYGWSYGTAYGEPAEAPDPPAYLGGLEDDALFTVGQSVEVSILDAFSNASSVATFAHDDTGALVSTAIGDIIPGLSLVDGVVTGAATAVVGRHWLTFRVSGPGGAADFEILVSAKPDMPNGAFRDGEGDLIPYVTVVQPPGTTTYSGNLTGLSNYLIRNVTFTSAVDIEDCENIGFDNCTFLGRVTVRSSSKIFFMGGSVDHIEEIDGWRISQTGTGSHDIVCMGMEIRNARKDGVNVAGDGSFNTGVRLLNLLVEDVGSASGAGAGFEHGFYVHGNVEIRGCVIRRCFYGNGISARSAGVFACNFIEDVLESAVSIYHDHPRSAPYTAMINGNVIARLIGEYGVRLRDASDYPANVLDEYTIAANRFGTGIPDVSVGAGYGSATINGAEGVGVLGNIRISTAAALALFPA